MQKFKILLPVIFLTFCILTAGCISSNLNAEDKIYADYMPHGYYYFIDDDGISFYETLWKDNMSDYINLHSSPKEWVYYIQHMRYISDGEDEAEALKATVSLWAVALLLKNKRVINLGVVNGRRKEKEE